MSAGLGAIGLAACMLEPASATSPRSFWRTSPPRWRISPSMNRVRYANFAILLIDEFGCRSHRTASAQRRQLVYKSSCPQPGCSTALVTNIDF